MPIDKPFKKKITKALDNRPLRSALGNFSRTYPSARESVYRGINFEELRDEIEKIKQRAVDNVDELADRFQYKLNGRGVHMHRAENGEAVATIIRDIARKRNATLAVKSKSMTTEEIHLNRSLEDVLKVVETDLGEWIIQQIDEKPSHMVMPAIHLTKEKCAEIFSRVLGNNVAPDIPRMVELAREILRKEFLAADIGITGCNIAVADTGTMVIFTNEGNARLTTTLPPVHIVVVGYEKLVSRFKDIAAPATAIPRSATCQYLTSYVTMISGPSPCFKAPGDHRVEHKELHVILLDNGRLKLLKDPVFKKIGQCVRCASCLNVCPVFGLVGGQVYGDVYTGGIGTLLTAFLSSHRNAEKIQELCLSCGKCRETCPGKIDIPGLILQLRSDIRSKIPPPLFQRMAVDKVLPYKQLLDLSVMFSAPVVRRLKGLPIPATTPFHKRFSKIEQNVHKQEGVVLFFYGCMIDYVYPGVGEAVIRMLNRAGFYVIVAPDHGTSQTCCGAPALYMGLEKSAEKMVFRNLAQWLKGESDYGEYDYIVTACPTCTAMLKKHWPEMLADHPTFQKDAEMIAEKTVDFIQLLHRRQCGQNIAGELTTETGTTSGVHGGGDTVIGAELTVTYHYSCHLKRTLGVQKEPGEVISALPGVTWGEMEEADQCCGFAGSYSHKLPDIAHQLLKRKVENIQKSGADVVLTDCPGCLYWIKKGLDDANSPIAVQHSVSFISQRTIIENKQRIFE